MAAKKRASRSASSDEEKKVPGLPIGFIPRVIVKFKDDAAPEYRDDALANDQEWNRLAEKYPEIRLKRLFTTVSPDRIRELERRARNKDSGHKLPNFLSFFAIEGARLADAPAIAKEISVWTRVETAYVDPPCRNPWELSEYVSALIAHHPSSGSSGCLNAVKAPYAWKFPGGAGEGQHLVDLEQGWDFCHQDLVTHFNASASPLLAGINGTGSRDHGTKVLGVICGHPSLDRLGTGAPACIGIAPNLASVKAVSYAPSLPAPAAACVGALPIVPISRNDAIISAVSHLEAQGGGVLLLEAEIGSAEAGIFGSWARSDHPIEIIPTDLAQIRLAEASNIVVIEAGGNAGQNLDDYEDQFGRHTLRASMPNPDFQESGAIMVGSSRQNLRPKTSSNYGSRINCFAWGEGVFSTNLDGTYTSLFDGTSSASAIIAGVTLSVLGLIAHPDNHLSARTPRQIRELLSDERYSRPSGPSPDSIARPIGRMPNLRKIAKDAFGLS